MVDINAGNVYITSGTVSGDTITGGITVEIDVQKVDNDLINTLIEFNIPVTPNKKTTTAPNANLIDLKKIKHVATTQGLLATDTVDAFTKKQQLMVLAGYGGNADDSLMDGQTIKSGAVTMVYGLSSQSSQHKIIGNIIKLSITEVPGKQSDGTKDTKIDMAYSVNVQVAVGTERG